MPNPKKFKDQKHFMEECMHITLHKEHKNLEQGQAQCLNQWRNRNKKKKACKVAQLFLARDELSGSESLFGFCGWLTSREEPTTMSSHDEAGHIADLVGDFCKTNDLSDPREGWEKKLIHPKSQDTIKANLLSRDVIKAFRIKVAYDFSSVQCNLPIDLSKEIYAWGKENIPDEELTGDGRQPEDDIHITCKYGLHYHDPFELRSYLAEIGPVDVTLGEVSVFENDDADVVQLSVVSPKLCELNKVISDNFEHTDTHPDFTPHTTICYLKPSFGKKYMGRKDFAGRKLKLDSVLFSGNDNRRTNLPLHV